MLYTIKSLTFVTIFHQSDCVTMHGQPKIAMSKSFLFQQSGVSVITVDTFMNFPKNVVPMFGDGVFKIKGNVTTFVKDIVDGHISW